jgi:hypothetical protein
VRSMRVKLLVPFVVLVTAGAAVLSACSTGASDPAPAATGEKLADSAIAVFEQALTEPGLSDFEHDVLERAVETGAITAADYEEAFARYEQCVADVGYTDTWVKNTNGLYVITPPPLDEDTVDRYGELTTECADGTTMRIEALYAMQQSNPELLADPREVAITCLHGLGSVPATFSVEDFDALMNSGFADAPFDLTDPEVTGCLHGAGYAITIG